MRYFARDINNQIKRGCLQEMILVAEERHLKQFDSLIKIINDSHEKGGDYTAAIFVTGPSASGKTVFSNRLSGLLKKEGYNSIVISLDDYYLDREVIHRIEKERGMVSPDAKQFDYETIDAFDVPFFRRQMTEFLNGEKIVLPLYDFNTGIRKSSDRIISKEKNTVLIVEGIQAMNPVLGEGLGFSKEFNIYICPFTDFRDESDGILVDTKQLRFMRRAIRDIISRGTPIARNMEMWTAVRQGEEKYIKPMKQYADFFFDSSLEYEIAFYRSRMDEIIKDLDLKTLEKLETIISLESLQKFIGVREMIFPHDSIFSEFYVG